ncbi:DNA topoisomerase 3-alpha [Pectinophora gossypiella]|uniref:DNA topoisomerase 3-alpha n=1 Tax=Pectinophora gossypiella TaxID=13191 RepID=UPI00214F0F68|nr:DNA topoisomerase 3-alpha [Pectinophora gossypiella]
MRYLFCNGYNLSRRINLRLCTNKLPVFVITRFKSETMKYLNVAEKNDAAKNIAAHLSRGTSRRREGLSQYNKIYEFEAEVMGQKAQMVMTSVSGHLLALEFVGSYKHWQACNPLVLFDAPVFKYCPENYEKIKKTLEREVRSCQGLIIWTDCDREGENIGFEIIQVCTAIKSNIPVYRAKFSEITAVSVRRALANLEQPNKNISDAVDVRQELDLRIGAAFTRFQTLRLQRVFPTKLAESLVSYGSCQFPTLGFVVERYRAVEAFVAEPFWKIKVNHTMNGLSVDFAWDRVRLFDRDACQVLHDICMENPQAKVVEVKTKPKSKWRPLPLDTVELEKLGSRKLKINAKETMRLAEKLYTQGLISYPRTETNEFPKEMNLGQLVGLQTGDPNWGAFAQGILDSGGPTPRQGNKSDKAHPPIHPTKHTNSLSGNEQRLYEFIVRSFLACCSKDAQGQETTASIDVAGERFSASGLMITARNYLDVYPYDKWSSKEIHVYQNGQTFNPTSIDMLDGTTSPPNLLTEADLIALMEKHGIGTDATHAEHIETIKSRSYVALADAIHFVPGLLGMGLVEGYDAMGLNISKPHLRAQLEADLKAISEGRKQPQVVLAEQIAKYKEVYLTVTAEANKIDAALAERFSERPNEYTPSVENMPDMPSALKCPKCGSDMVVRPKKNSDEFFISCISFPKCKNAVWFPTIVKTLQVLPDSCPSCGPNYKKIKFEWRNNSISHLYPPPYVGCIGGCDTTFLELLKINLSSVRNLGNRTQQTGTNNTITGLSTRDTTSTMVPAPSRTNQTRPNNTQTRPANQPRQTVNSQPRQFLPPPTVNRGQNAGPRMPAPRGSGDPDDNNVICGCNKAAILLTVRKQNANCGKKFYKCPDGGCDFFLWAPESLETGTNNFDTPPASNSWNANNASQNNSGWGNDSGNSRGNAQNSTRGWGITPSSSRDSYPSNEDDVMCNCGVPCKKVTVHKEGPNKGRPFYGCPKEFNNRCNFFQWADGGGSNTTTEWGASSSSSNTRGRGRGRGGRGGGGGSDAGRGRRCGICRQEGHTRSRCPNANAD